MSRIPSEQERPPSEAVPDRAERPPRGGSAGLNLLQVRLRTLPVDEALALLEGAGAPAPGLHWHEEYPMAETMEALAMLVAAHRVAGPTPDSPFPAERPPTWWLHQIVLDDLVVGDIGFHGPPSARGPVEVEIGYHVVPDLRGQGIATRASALLQRQAWADGATVVWADTVPENLASQRVLLRSGFRDRGDFRFRADRPVGCAGTEGVAR